MQSRGLSKYQPCNFCNHRIWMQRIIVTSEPIQQCLHNKTKIALLYKSLSTFRIMDLTKFIAYKRKQNHGINNQPLCSSSSSNNEIKDTCLRWLSTIFKHRKWLTFWDFNSWNLVGWIVCVGIRLRWFWEATSTPQKNSHPAKKYSSWVTCTGELTGCLKRTYRFMHNNSPDSFS